MSVPERPPSGYVFTLYLAERSPEELAALSRLRRELADGEVGEPDGGGFASAHVAGASERAALDSLQAALIRAIADDLIEIDHQSHRLS